MSDLSRKVEKSVEVLIIAAVGLFLLWVGFLLLWLIWPSAESARDRRVSFIGDLRSGEFEDAYGQLCPALQDEISLKEFEGSEGQIFGPMFEIVGRSWDWEYFGGETRDNLITETWNDISSGDGNVVFRVRLVRDGGRWSVCGAERLSAESARLRYLWFADVLRADHGIYDSTGRDRKSIHAYGLVCEDYRSSVSHEDFDARHQVFDPVLGGEFRPVIRLGRSAIETAAEYSDAETLDESVIEAWFERTIGDGDGFETYRIRMARDPDGWAVCGVERS